MASVKAMRETIRMAWHHLERVTFHKGLRTDLQRLAWEAEAAEVTAEKEHRAMGRRFNSPGYRLSVADTARLFVLQHAYQSATGAAYKPDSWRTVAQTAHRVALSFAVGEVIRDASLVAEAFPSPEFMGIEYAQDVAR